MPVMRRTIVEHGSVIVDVNGDTLTGKMIDRDGAEADVFSIVKRGQVNPAPLALPWMPPEYKKSEGEAKKVGAPVDHKVVIEPDAEWTFTFDQPVRWKDWTQPGFDTAAWKKGVAPFGYGKVDFQTDVREMRRKHTVLYARCEFTIGQADRITEVGLDIDYADGFIAYLNGREVARGNVARSSGRNVQGVKNRDSRGIVQIPLPDALKALQDGVNILAIEAHNATVDEVDFLLAPSLIVED